jgi:exodeoxyribonuclease VII large subunit
MSTRRRAERDSIPDDPERDRVYRVSELNRAVRVCLEQEWPVIWIEGELSDVTRAASGHLYFTLNDEEESAQLRGVMFRNDARRSRVDFEDGTRVKLRGSVTLFEPRGTYQLIARVAEPAGLGDLHRQFERIRRKLEAEGLFAPERKRRLPRLPSVIGVVTSTGGAALHDIIRVSSERCPVQLVVSHCLVQGPEAPESIVDALREIQRLPELDLVIVGRGGGSAEDLFAFNDERVARAIADCRVPTVSAVGHEIDFTIADLAADVRAATPSNAAELAVPEREVLASELSNRLHALQRTMEVLVARHRLTVDRIAGHLRDPREALGTVRGRLDAAGNRLERTAVRRLREATGRLREIDERLSRTDPRFAMARDRTALTELRSRLRSSAGPLSAVPGARLSELSARLRALSPLAILSRGYAIAIHEPTGKALLRSSEARPGDDVTVRLHEGRLRTRVIKGSR